MPLTKTGRGPGITEMQAQVTVALTWPDLASVRGRPTDRPPHNGVQGTGRPSSQHVVSPNRPAVRCHGDRNGLDRSRRPARSCAAVAGAALGRPYAAFAAAAGLPNSNSPPVT